MRRDGGRSFESRALWGREEGLGEEGVEGEESLEGVGAELFHLVYHFFERLLFSEIPGFREKFIGIADGFLFDGDGAHVSVWERKILSYNIFYGQAGAGVSFTHEGMSRITEAFKHFPPLNTMTYVGKGAVAVDGGGVTHHYPDVVE